MADRFFAEFSEHFDLPDTVQDDSRAVWLLRLLDHAGDAVVEGWDPAQLEVACRTVSGSADGTIPRIHLVFACPLGAAGAIPVAEYTRALASRYDLQARCILKGGSITVTVERQGK